MLGEKSNFPENYKNNMATFPPIWFYQSQWIVTVNSPTAELEISLTGLLTENLMYTAAYYKFYVVHRTKRCNNH